VNPRQARAAAQPFGRYVTPYIGPVLEDAKRSISWHGEGVTGERRRKNAPASAGRVPGVLTGIIDAAALSEQRCHAVPPPSIRGC